MNGAGAMRNRRGEAPPQRIYASLAGQISR
jgi:hypothetical protein